MVKLEIGYEKANKDLDITVKTLMLGHLKSLYKYNTTEALNAEIYKCKLCGSVRIYIEDGYSSRPEKCHCDGNYDDENFGIYEHIGSRKDYRLPIKTRELFNAFWDKLWIDEEGVLRGKYV